MRFVSLKASANRNFDILCVSRNLESESLSPIRADIPPERRAGGGWAAVVSIINLKFSAATASASAVGEEIERTKQLEMAHCAHHCRDV